MLRLVARRLLWSIPLLLLASILTFVLVSLVPGNPAQTILGIAATPQQIAALQQQMGLNQPLLVQYWQWLTNAVTGNFGTSLIDGQSVTDVLAPRLGATLTLVIGGMLVASAVGVALGVLAATRAGVVANLVDAAAAVGLAVPNFWLGLILIEVFSVQLHLFPSSGLVPLNQDPVGWLQSSVLPVIAVAVSGLTFVAVQTRDSMLEVLRGTFLRVLEANGIPRRSVIYKHALRSAAIPVVTVIGVVFVGLLGGTVVVESVFTIPGLGSELVTAAAQHDIPVIQGLVVYFTLIVIVLNVLVEVAYGVLNPRVRVSS